MNIYGKITQELNQNTEVHLEPYHTSMVDLFGDDS